jgi:hypothetical protein
MKTLILRCVHLHLPMIMVDYTRRLLPFPARKSYVSKQKLALRMMSTFAMTSIIVIPYWDEGFKGSNAERFPLLTRRWAFQERLLSRRLLHFSEGELMWECLELSDCECFQGEPGDRSPFMPFHSPKHRHRQDLLRETSESIERYWNVIVSTYSSLHLTLPKDKLPALSGVAKQTLRFRPGDEYLAGLWRTTIISDLRWTALRGNGQRLPK